LFARVFSAMAVGMATVDDPGVGVTLKGDDECEVSSTVVAIFEGLARGAASRQVVAAAAAAVFRCASATCRSTCSEVERHVKDRLGLIAQPLRAQVAEGLATGSSSRNAAHLVSRDTLVRSNAAKHQGFQSDVLISEVPLGVLRNRQRGARKKELAKEAEEQSKQAELELAQEAEQAKVKDMIKVANDKASEETAYSKEKSAENVEQAAEDTKAAKYKAELAWLADAEEYFDGVYDDLTEDEVNRILCCQAMKAEVEAAKIKADGMKANKERAAEVNPAAAGKSAEEAAKEEEAAAKVKTRMEEQVAYAATEEKAAKKAKVDNFANVDMEIEDLAQRIDSMPSSGWGWEQASWRRSGWR
jgi:hypothetical protein